MNDQAGLTNSGWEESALKQWRPATQKGCKSQLKNERWFTWTLWLPWHGRWPCSFGSGLFCIARCVCVRMGIRKSVTLAKSSQWRLLKLPVWWGWLLNENQSSSLNWCLYYLPFIFVMSSSSFESIIFTLAVYILSLLPNIWSKLWG